MITGLQWRSQRGADGATAPPRDHDNVVVVVIIIIIIIIIITTTIFIVLSSTALAICKSSLWFLWVKVGQRQVAANS